ncbi:DUF92 domain-containing protein [Ferroplasma sp.]|uniref:DUF92 domain-containing protein n=1 Tax=Ferroplasma sp. TaxID=2591003 RepID=UPI00307E4143
MNIYYIITSVAILLTLFVFALKFNVFDFKGTVAALIVGIIVLVLGSLYWLILMLIFAVTAQLATKFRIKEKMQRKLQEGENGERHASNVIYAALIGIAIAVMNAAKIGGFPYFLIFGVSFASVNADTFASEIGVFDSNVYMITSLKKIRPGINGGISLLGEAAALFGAFIIGISYVILNFHGFDVISLLVITVLGFTGCQIDSILGALFENKGKMSKGQVNAFSTLLAVAIAFILYL